MNITFTSSGTERSFSDDGIRGIIEGEDFSGEAGDLQRLPFVQTVIPDGSRIAVARNLDRSFQFSSTFPPLFPGTLVDRIAADGTIDLQNDRHDFVPVSRGASQAVTAEGRLYVSGGSEMGAVIQAYRPDGRVVSSFGKGGFVSSEDNEVIHAGWDVLPLGDGSVYTHFTGNHTLDGDPIAIVLDKLRSNGSFDPNFAGFDSSDESSLQTLKQLPGESLSFGFNSIVANQTQFYLFRGNDTFVKVEISGSDDEEDQGPDGAAAIAQSQAYYATGFIREFGDLRRVLMRYSATGGLDHTFANNGVLLDFAGEVLWGQANGKLLNTLPGQSGLRRLNNDGTSDPTFGAGGVAAAGFTNFDIDSQGRILAFREVRSGISDGDVQVRRMSVNGKIDTSFGGGDGLVTVDTRVSSAATPHLLITPVDDIIVTSYESIGTDVRWSATRLLGA